MAPSNTAPRPALVSMSRVQQVYGFSRSTGYRLAAQKKIKVVKLGRRSFVVDESVRIDELPELVTRAA